MTDPIGISGPAWRKDFWDHFISRHPIEEEYAKSTKNSSRWRGLAQQRIVIVQYLAALAWVYSSEGRRRQRTRRRRFVWLPLQQRWQANLDGNHNVPKAFFQSRKSINARDRANWDAMADWLHNKANDYQAVVLRVL